MKHLWKFMVWLVILGFVTAGVYHPALASETSESTEATQSSDSHVVDQDAKCSITLTNLGGETAASGGAFVAYRVATVDYDDGNAVFRSLYGDQEIVDVTENVTNLASQYYTLVSEKAVEDPTDQVEAAEGKLTFSNLKPGLYLIVQQTAITGYNSLTPFLVSVPTWDKDTSSYVYERTAVVKNDISAESTTEPEPPTTSTEPPTTSTEPPTDTTEPPYDEDDVDDDSTDDDSSDNESSDSSSSREKLPQTGQLWWPLPLLLCAGLILMLVGRKIRK